METSGGPVRLQHEVWNRACADVVDRALMQPGDRALVAMLLVHSLAMNGGLLHAIESLLPSELAEGIDGYRHFGLDDAAAVIGHISAKWGDGDLDLEAAEALEFEADERYAAVVPDDGRLVSAFEARLEAHPTEFAPVERR